MRIPPLALPSTHGRRGWCSLELPGAHRPCSAIRFTRAAADEELPPGWNPIPRRSRLPARGLRDSADRHERFADLGVRVLALSDARARTYQREMA